jgi:hypothetical protein
VGTGLLINHLEVSSQLGDEFLAGCRSCAAPEISGGNHIAHDRLMLGLQCGGLGPDRATMGIDITELIIDRHC